MPTIKQENSSLLGIFDLTDPIKDVYLSVLKAGVISLNDYKTIDSFRNIDKDELKIYLDILVRQEYLEKFKDEDIVKYKVKGLKRKTRTVPTSIWDKLEQK